MIRPHRITKRVLMSRQAMLRGVFDLPPGVSFLVSPNHRDPRKWTRVGEFPHAESVPIERQCRAVLLVLVKGGREDEHLFDPDCTIVDGHDGEHVAHIAPGAPVAAWTDDWMERTS